MRRAAVIMLPRDAAHRDLLIESGALTDDSPNGQLAALSALIEMPVDPLVGDALVEALTELEGTNDHWLPTAFSLAAIRNAESFLPTASLKLHQLSIRQQRLNVTLEL